MPDLTWQISRRDFSPERLGQLESIFSLGNGFLGFRGDWEEGAEGMETTGTFLNGFFDTRDIAYGEKAYGFAPKNQSMLNLCNPKSMRLWLDDEAFSLFSGTVLAYQQTMDVQKGITTREIHWRSPKEKEVRIRIRRMVSFSRKELAWIGYEIESVNFSGEITLKTAIDGRRRKVTSSDKDDPRIGTDEMSGHLRVTALASEALAQGLLCLAQQKTLETQKSLVCVALDIPKTTPLSHDTWCDQDRIGAVHQWEIQPGETLSLERWIVMAPGDDTDAAQEALCVHAKAGAAAVLAEQEAYLEQFWQGAKIEVLGNDSVTQALRFGLFHLLQSAGRDGQTSVAAKGLTGNGYDGHYFWEAEAYIAPVFFFVYPEIGRKMLEYRYHILDKARAQARLLGHQKGALYAWRSIDGTECSAYYPAGSAQYHLSADIAFSTKRYVQATSDWGFMAEYGAEIVVETARLWLDVGHFQEKGFCIDGVTGPDEYTAVVNNNAYTNLMARENLLWALETMDWLEKNAPEKSGQLKERLSLTPEELQRFSEAAGAMYIPYDHERKLFCQDDTFLNKKRVDLSTLKKPLLLHYHPLFIYRQQVCKQPDLILGQWLLCDQFSQEQLKRDYAYYEQITTHDSSLSACIFSAMACEIGDYSKAEALFTQSVRLDLDDTHNNTRDGLHMATMAGSWLCVAHGFAGTRIKNGKLTFRHRLLPGGDGYAFRMWFQGRLLSICARKEAVEYRLLQGAPLAILHEGEELLLKDTHQIRRDEP